MNREQRRVVVLIWFVSSVASLEIDTLDGGYKNLLVSISEAVPYDESIIEDIKALFRSSSEFLHRATNGRVYFKQVTIEIPKAWPRRENARNVSLSSFEQSDIRIDLPSEPYGDRPFTQQLRPCGQPGDFIQLTPRFLAQLGNSTGNQPLNMAYIFVHQWAHFRYGVFDEHGCHGDNEYPLTYCHSGKVKLNACSERIGFAARTATGGKCSVDKVCRLSEDCVVSLQHSSSGHPIESSIMFMPRVGNVSQFCDDAVGGIQHNPFAPNKQNRLCQQKSTWEVISGNADFQKLPKPDISKRIEISFVVTQETNVTQRVVLVLDVSSSMQNYRRLEFLKEAITRYVNGMANDLRRLAILTFSKSATVVHPLTLVNAGTKPGFLSAIKRLKTEGPTCIGCGLRDAVVHLKNSTETTEGATIVLVSDGEGNTGPKIKSVMPRLLKAKVVVSTLAVGGTAAEKLEKLASQTRGKAYAFQDMQGNMALEMEAAFVEATTPSLEKASRAHTLVDTVESLHGLLKRTFQVDSSVGNETVVYVKVNDRHKAQIEAWLVDPSGQRCQACHKTSTAAGIAIAMPSPAEVGTWILHLRSATKVEVNVQVKSKARKEGVEPIQLSCTMSNMLVDRPDAAVVYAKISRGKKVALGASVFADVRGPKPGRNSTLQLHDDGREPDNHASDGTYSGYFTKFTGKGRYTVTAHVLHQNGTRLAYPLDSSACVVGIATHNTSDESTGASLDFASEHPIDDFNLVNTTAIATSDNGTSIEIVDPFERVASGGSFQVMEPIFESHVPPGNIRDLSAANARPGENGTLLVELTFTWPGAHLTSGKASSVEIRASKDYAKLKSDFGSQTEIAKLNVTERSLEQVVVVSLPSLLATPQQDGASTWNAYVAARATNKDGLKSNTSNVVPLYYTPPQLSTTLAMTTLTSSGATSTIATTKPTTTNAETTTTEIITPKERATTNAANTTAEISKPTERATTNTETTTAEIPTPTEHTTTNAATMTAEIKTPTERATTKTATTNGEITTPTERATTNAATTTTEITTPTEGATTNAATTTAEITTPTERATTNAPTTTAEITKPTKRATTNATTATAEITTPRERATTKASSTPAEINTTKEPATTKAATSTAEIHAPTERATTNAANTSAEITAPKEGATTNAETSTVEITTPTERATTNAATTTTEITTPAERATTNASTTTTEISTPTERGTTKAATTTAEITSPTEGATKNAATTTAEITPTERATKSSLTTIPLRSTTEASLSRVTTGMSTAAPSTKWPATSTLLTTTLSPATLPTTAEERSIETPTTTEASTDSCIPSNVNGYHTTGTGTPSLTVFLTLSKWVPIGGAIAAAIVAILFALVRRKNRRNYRSSSRRARKEPNASALLA